MQATPSARMGWTGNPWCRYGRKPSGRPVADEYSCEASKPHRHSFGTSPFTMHERRAWSQSSRREGVIWIQLEAALACVLRTIPLAARVGIRSGCRFRRSFGCTRRVSTPRSPQPRADSGGSLIRGSIGRLSRCSWLSIPKF